MLEDVRVIEVSMLAPSTLGMHLADLGADVIKVEDPARGDYVRIIGIAPGETASYLHRRWNRGKRSIALDLRTPGGVKAFEDLVRSAEIVIEGLRPGGLERRGLGYERLQQINPRIVFVSINGFGQFGPYRDIASHGPAFEAYAGLAAPVIGRNGLPRIPAGKGGVGIQAAPLLGALGALAALVQARATGKGCSIDVAEGDGAVYWNAHAVDKVATDRYRESCGIPILAPPFDLPDHETDLFEQGTRCQYYETSDGRHLIFMPLERYFLENFAKAMGRPDLLTISRSTKEFDHEYGNEALRQALADIFLTRSLAEWLEVLDEANVPALPVNVGDTLLDDSHFQARTRWVDPAAHEGALMAMPLHADPPLPTPNPAPRLGEHTDEILDQVLGYTAQQIGELTREGVFGRQPAAT